MPPNRKVRDMYLGRYVGALAMKLLASAEAYLCDTLKVAAKR